MSSSPPAAPSSLTSATSSAPGAKRDQGDGAEPVGATPSPHGFLRRHGLKLAVSFVIAGAFAWMLKRGGLPLIPDAAALGHVSWALVGVHLLQVIVVHFVRGARWRHLLRPLAPEISTRRVLAASWIGFTAILLLPLRAGEVVRPYLIRDGKKVTLSAALGTLGAERVIDGLVVTGVLAGALVFVPRLDPLPKTFGELHIPVAAIPAAGYLALAVFVAAFGAMAVFYFARSFARHLVMATIGRISPRVGDRLASIVEGIASGLHFLADVRHALPFLAETLIYWGLNAMGMWTLGVACGLSMTFGHACAVMGVLAVGILVPAGPGLFGAFQAATYGALAMYFPSGIVTGPGSAYVFLLYGVQFFWHLVAACVGVAFDRTMLRTAEDTLEA